MDRTAQRALELLSGTPAGRRALAVSDRFAGLWLVGGAIRDAILDAPARDIDLAVDGEAEPVARALGHVLERHERFGTAEVLAGEPGERVNLARTRTETYSRPGALPDVRPAGIEDDLRRRDFTVNAIAVGVSPAVRGQLRAAEHALEDLAAGRLRVLHPRSFQDDPTRLLRLARYRSRLGLVVEDETARLTRAADLSTVAAERVGNEVRLLLAEADPLAALGAATELGVLPDLAPDRELVEQARALLPADGRDDLLVLASGAARRRDRGLPARLRALGLPAGDVERAGRAARAPELAQELRAARRPSEVAAAARGWPPEAVALAAALGATPAARAWLEDLRHVRLAIDGRDLLAAGVPEGPEVGRRLARTLARRLDGELVPGRTAELEAALA